MAQFLGTPKVQYFDVNGDPLVGGKLYAYEVGSATLKDTYPTIADAVAKTNANTNPVTLDSRGEADVVLGGPTKLVLKDSNLNTIWTVDNVSNDTGTVLDADGNEILAYGAVASAVNYLKVYNSITGVFPRISAEGEADTGIRFTNSEDEDILQLNAVASSVNYTTLSNSSTGNPITIEASGSDTDIGFTIAPKGAGYLNIRSTATHTNSVHIMQYVNAQTSGTPAAGIGVGTTYRCESADETDSDFGTIGFAASDVASGSEDTYFTISTRVAGASLAEAYRFASTNSSGKYVFTGAPSTTRTITLPDADMTLAITASATQTEAEAGSSTTVAMTPGNMRYSPHVAKCHANINGTGTAAVTYGNNVSSVTDNGTGDMTVTSSLTFTNTSSMVPIATADGVVIWESNGARTTTQVRLITRALNTTLTDCIFSVAIFGDLP